VNVASLELCRELYELSGWWDTSHRYYSGDGYTGKLMDQHYWDEHFADEAIREGELVPAYDLGYLFAGLLAGGSFSVRYVSPANPLATDLKEWSGKCIAFTPEMKQKDYPVDGLAADATAKLVIYLFKQGTLERDA
jgi:hypothetical protein